MRLPETLAKELAPFYRVVESTFRLLRPEFWVVSIFPAWVGWVLATGLLVPAQNELFGAARDGIDVSDLTGWASGNLQALLTVVTLGPLLGGSIMITNDYFDRKADVFNPKKVRSPLVAGTATEARAISLMVALVALTILVGFLIRYELGLLMVAGEMLSFAYSAPPIRIKARPLGDLLANAAGYGVITTTAGWLLGRGPEDLFPLAGLLILVLAMAAVTFPTIMMDRAPDLASGLRTSAVVLGHRACRILGFECLIGANLLMAVLALSGIYVPAAFLGLQFPFFALEAFAYIVLVRQERPSRLFLGASLCVIALFANLGAFLMVYGGLWRIA